MSTEETIYQIFGDAGYYIMEYYYANLDKQIEIWKKEHDRKFFCIRGEFNLMNQREELKGNNLEFKATTKYLKKTSIYYDEENIEAFTKVYNHCYMCGRYECLDFEFCLSVAFPNGIPDKYFDPVYTEEYKRRKYNANYI